MKTLVITTQFKRDLRLCNRRHYDIAKLQSVLELLTQGNVLPLQYRDHALVGNWLPKRECHIAPDWLLIYETNETEVRLAKTGTHSDLFGR